MLYIMTETHCTSSGRSSSSENTSLPDTEDDQTIAQLLAEEEKLSYGGNQQLGRRLSHLDSIPVCLWFQSLCTFLFLVWKKPQG